jgi:uncharacterized protein
MLKISKDISLPTDACTQTIAIVARKRVGKTYTASVIAEEMIEHKIPIVVLDPTGAWWGLRSMADGKEGHPVIIIGGAHGDIPLDEHAGKIIADLVVDHPGYYIIDFSDIGSDAAQDRFATDFGQHFYRRKQVKRFPMHLFIDEADCFCPQQPFPAQKRMLGAYDNIVRRGGISGIGVTLITQRPAVLNKNVLTQAETLIALQMSGSQDIDAIEHWIRIHGSKVQRDQMISSLPTLQRGQAWFWSPSWLQKFEVVSIRQRHTFNSSATPEAGDKTVIKPRLRPVDLKKLGESIQSAIETVKDSDPVELRKRIAAANVELGKLRTDLERAIASKPKVSKADVSKVTAENRNLRKLLESAMKFLVEVKTRNFPEDTKPEEIRTAIQSAFDKAFPQIEAKIKARNDEMTALKTRMDAWTSRIEKALKDPVSVNLEVSHNEPFTVKSSETPDVSPANPFVSEKADGNLNSAQVKFLSVLAQRRGKSTNRSQIAVFTGFSSRSSHVDNTISSLRTSSLLEGGRDNLIITEAGLKALGDKYQPLPTGQDLFAYWAGKLPSAGAKMLKQICLVYPNTLTRDQVAEQSGLSITSSHVDNTISNLRTLELISGGRDALKASKELME